MEKFPKKVYFTWFLVTKGRWGIKGSADGIKVLISLNVDHMFALRTISKKNLERGGGWGWKD